MTDEPLGAACARAALAGNPSDLHGGAVLAIPVSSLVAAVVGRSEPVDANRLINATLARIGVERDDLACHTTIPQSVGLAGSSAIVIATLRACDAAPADPLELARLALSIERDDLGIVAGLQDRAVQAFGSPVLVDMADERVVRRISPKRPLRFVIAWLAAAAGDSGDYHAALEHIDVAASMDELATIAREAAGAFRAGDATALARSMGESAKIRAHAAPLSSEHEQLADTLRAIGLTPNSTGSGGAVVAVVFDDEQLDALRERALDFVVETVGA